MTNAALDVIRRRPAVAETADEPWTTAQTAEAETRIDLQKHWARLSREHQAALLLVDMLGYSIAEAAEILAVPGNTVKSSAARARVALAGKLECQQV